MPIAELIGFTVSEIGDGRAVGSFQADPHHANPMGTLHGGVLCGVSDAAMGMALARRKDARNKPQLTPGCFGATSKNCRATL